MFESCFRKSLKISLVNELLPGLRIFTTVLVGCAVLGNDGLSDLVSSCRSGAVGSSSPLRLVWGVSEQISVRCSDVFGKHLVLSHVVMIVLSLTLLALKHILDSSLSKFSGKF